MASSAFIISFITTDATVGTMGEVLGRGTVISLILVMTVLPQLLLIGDTLIEKTATLFIYT